MDENIDETIMHSIEWTEDTSLDRDEDAIAYCICGWIAPEREYYTYSRSEQIKLFVKHLRDKKIS